MVFGSLRCVLWCWCGQGRNHAREMENVDGKERCEKSDEKEREGEITSGWFPLDPKP